MTQFTSRSCAVFLVPLLFACAGDSTGPDHDDDDDVNVPAVVSDKLTAEIYLISVDHDCDPATDNPGDFSAWVEIWQGPPSDARRLAATPKRNMSLHSGTASYRNDLRVEALIARVPAREVNVYTFVQELDDNGLEDANGNQNKTLSWSLDRDCWVREGSCIEWTNANKTEAKDSWMTQVRKRADVFNLFNPDDEGCAFDVVVNAKITK